MTKKITDNNGTILVTVKHNGQEITLPVTEVTDLVRIALAARKEAYDLARQNRNAISAAKKAEREKARSEKAAEKAAKKAARISDLEAKLAELKAA